MISPMPCAAEKQVQLNFYQPSVQGSVQTFSSDGRNDVKLFTHTRLSGEFRTQPMQERNMAQQH